MQRLITFPIPSRSWRLWCGFVLGLLWLGVSHAATPLNGAWRETRPGDTPQRVLAEYQAGQLKSFEPALLHSFPRSRSGSWVVLAPQPPLNDNERLLTIYPAPLGPVTVYADGHSQTVAMDEFSAGLHGHGRLAWRIPPGVAASAPIVLKFDPSSTLSAPVEFQMPTLNEYLHRDAQWLVFASTSLAVMLAMVLMALCFALMLRDITFGWYAGYILCYALIQGIQTGFVFHPLEWQWLVGRDVMIGSAAVALSVAFASMFMMRFCELQRYAPLLRIPIMALAVGMIQLVLMRCSGIPALIDIAQMLLNPLLIIGAVLLLVAAIAAAARGSRQAWFFLVGWTPLLLLTAATSAQVNGALPEMAWINDASLAGGAFEALVLSLGLADRALRLRHDRDFVRVLADHDALTNVLNRRGWSDRANALLASGAPRPVAMLFLDLDHFKCLNDCHGHHAGDRALVAVSKALQAELRPADILGRYGGEEFVALLDSTNQQQAMHVATRLCRRVHRLEMPISEGPDLLTISIGVALHQDGDDLAALIERADQAMYDAKLNGRNRVYLYRAGAATDAPDTRHLHAVETRKSER